MAEAWRDRRERERWDEGAQDVSEEQDDVPKLDREDGFRSQS